MAWCEAHEVSCVLGLVHNARQEALLVSSLDAARARHCLCGGATSSVLTEFFYRTQKSRSRERRVIGKAGRIWIMDRGIPTRRCFKRCAPAVHQSPIWWAHPRGVSALWKRICSTVREMRCAPVCRSNS